MGVEVITLQEGDGKDQFKHEKFAKIMKLKSQYQNETFFMHMLLIL